MVGSPIGSDLSFIVKRKKLFAHKVLVACFSDSLGETLMSKFSGNNSREIED
jgi:hypothetical protein